MNSTPAEIFASLIGASVYRDRELAQKMYLEFLNRFQKERNKEDKHE